MGGAGKKADECAFVKGRRDHGDVVQVSCTFPGVIGDVDVAIANVFTPNPPNEMSNRVGHCIDVSRCPGDSLGQHVSIDIVDPSR